MPRTPSGKLWRAAHQVFEKATIARLFGGLLFARLDGAQEGQHLRVEPHIGSLAWNLALEPSILLASARFRPGCYESIIAHQVNRLVLKLGWIEAKDRSQRCARVDAFHNLFGQGANAGKATQVLASTTHDRLNAFLFEFEELIDFFISRAILKPDARYIVACAQAMCPVLCLLHLSRCPGPIHHHDDLGSRQVDPDPASADGGHQRVTLFRLEPVDHGL